MELHWAKGQTGRTYLFLQRAVEDGEDARCALVDIEK
jgi:hypothetical protein